METSPPQETITLSVFISSPSDLKKERDRARDLIKGMSGMVIEGLTVAFEPKLWEDHTPSHLGSGPQDLVNQFMGYPEDMDIYVGMLWTTMGSEAVLDERYHRSGTRYEFDRAFKGYSQKGSPLMLLYRCTRPHADASLKSIAEVDEFFSGFTGPKPKISKGFVQSFVEEDDFVRFLTRDLEKMAESIIQKRSAQRKEGQELEELVTSVYKWLSTFEDLFGRNSEDRKRERDRLFNIHFRALPDPLRPAKLVPEELLPRENEDLLDVFDQWNGRMLMVGERGTGKTFAMLRLMQDLAARAFHQPGERVPVFFNLSSWSETYHERARPPSLFVRVMRKLFQPPSSDGTLNQWLEDQMVRNYSMQRKAARRLLGRNEIILCLDGLDELSAGSGSDVATEQASRDLREACVRAINATLGDPTVRMILCCREQADDLLDDGEAACRPELGAPLQTQLLTPAEVLDDLQNWPLLGGLKTAMEKSPKLLERARVALFLGMMRVAYRGMSAELILTHVEETDREWERHLLAHYVDQCMKMAPPEAQELNKELVPRCLSWMAQMPDNDFLLDDLQPSLLRADDGAEGERQWRSYRFFSVLLLALSLTIVETVPPGLALATEHWYCIGWWSAVTHCLAMWGVSAAILFPLYVGAFKARSWVWFGLCFGLAWSLDSAACVYLSVPGDQGGTTAESGTLAGVIKIFPPSLAGGCIFFMLMGMQFYERLAEHRRCYSSRAGIQWHEILPVEPMNWCWFDEKSYWRGGWIGLIVGPLVLAIGWLGGEGMYGTVAGLLVTGLVTMFSGLSGTGIARVSIEPNQGIARSLRHALFMTGIFVVGGSFCWGLIYWVNKGWVQGLVGAFMGLTLGFAIHVFGGIPVTRQFCLGSVLHREGKLPTWWCWPPWKVTVQFLDDLVRYKLLRRSAGGYMFRHQSLREHYRHLPDLTTSGAGAKKPKEASVSPS